MIRNFFPESWLFDSIDGNDTEYVFCGWFFLCFCVKIPWVLPIASLLINLPFFAIKLIFFIDDEDYSYLEEEAEGIEDRFAFDSFSDSLLPSVPLAHSPREVKKENIIDIRKIFPETWIFDSIYNVSLG